MTIYQCHCFYVIIATFVVAVIMCVILCNINIVFITSTGTVAIISITVVITRVIIVSTISLRVIFIMITLIVSITSGVLTMVNKYSDYHSYY